MPLCSSSKPTPECRTLPQRTATLTDPYLIEGFGSERSESFVFNELEEIVNSEKPRTPALGCSAMYALSRSTSRTNSDQITICLRESIEYLIKWYHIRARNLIESVHDKLQYLVKEEDDKYRAASARVDLWTRTMFVYMLGMDDLPQGVAFFSAVDVDRCLRKEVDMECVTPSQPVPVPPGESLNIEGVLEKTRESLGEEHGIETTGLYGSSSQHGGVLESTGSSGFWSGQGACTESSRCQV